MRKIASVVFTSLFLAACSSTPKTASNDNTNNAASSSTASVATPSQAELDARKLAAQMAALPKDSIYFDFDKSEIRADQKDRIKKNGDLLNGSASARVRVEGNTDERGTNEYNMALGERRAVTAVKYLVNMGVAEGRIDTLSFGEEKPLNLGHDEMAWSQNRRDDFVIVK